VLRSFDGTLDGAKLRGPVLVAAGKYYGTATSEGPKGGGSVFQIAPPPP
jgi:hypothetical protein